MPLRRRLGGLAFGGLLATFVALSPLAAQPALAAGQLKVQAATTYTVDPADGRVHVAIRYTMTNNKPNTPTIIYYYRALTVGVQADARGITAADGSGRLGVTTRRHEFFTEVEVRLRANLYYHRSTTFTLRYDLVGGAPRSESPVRIGEAFVTFGVWAFGDENQGTVEVRLPAGFTSSVEGDPMTTTNGASGAVLRAKPANTDEFFAIITAESRDDYDESRVSLPGGVEIVVLSWPEDDQWEESATGTLETGFPELQGLVGLDWPVAHDLTIRERYTPALEGYAGIFFTEDQRIDVSEDLDPVTIMHEASHAWFNESLFRARWIYEGLAEEYAWLVQTAVGGDNDGPPDPPAANAPGSAALETWVFPDVIRDDTSDREVYGYEASFWVVHLVVQAAGEDQMREAFASADANLTAYPGEGSPETVGPIDDWRRFLDLTQPIDAPDPAAVLEAIDDYVLGGATAAELAARLDARERYRELLEAGDGWLPPWYIREAMGRWQFGDATRRMAEASAVLDVRHEIEGAAAAEGLAPNDALEAAYEGATGGLDEAKRLANRELQAISAIAGARTALDVETDLFAQLGLIGQTPTVPYEAARAAFSTGDLDAAIAQAGAVAAIVGRAPAAGQERVIMGAIVLVAVVVLLAFVVLLRRRRSRQAMGVLPGSAAFLALDARFAPGADGAPAVELAAAVAAPPDAAAAPDPIQPSGTLAPDPDSQPLPLGEGPSDGEVRG